MKEKLLAYVEMSGIHLPLLPMHSTGAAQVSEFFTLAALSVRFLIMLLRLKEGDAKIFWHAHVFLECRYLSGPTGYPGRKKCHQRP